MKRIIYIFLSISISLVSCSKEDIDSEMGNKELYIAAALQNTIDLTKTPYELTVPTKDNPLVADVWASSTSHTFIDKGWDGSGEIDDNDNVGDVAKHATAKFQSGDPQLLTDIIYAKDGKPVYFVGFYPSEGWTTGQEGITGTHTFTGKEDIMFAPQVTGSYIANGSNTWPTLHFRHLLTRFTLELKADGETTPEQESIRDAWGKIQSITIASNSKVNIDLSSASYGTDGSYNFDKISYETNASLPFYQSGTDNVFPEYDPNTEGSGYSIPTGEEAQEVAYVMCSPVNASEDTEDYTITISTEKRKNVAVKVNLKQTADSDFPGSTMGYHFTLQLNFKMGDRITVSAAATDWSTGGTGSADIGEGNINTTNN